MSNEPQREDGWDVWGRHVLICLKELRTDISGMREQLGELRGEVYTLKGRAMAWGAIGGVVVAVAVAVATAIITLAAA